MVGHDQRFFSPWDPPTSWPCGPPAHWVACHPNFPLGQKVPSCKLNAERKWLNGFQWWHVTFLSVEMTKGWINGGINGESMVKFKKCSSDISFLDSTFGIPDLLGYDFGFKFRAMLFLWIAQDMFYHVLWYFQLLLGSKPVGLPRCFPSQGFSLWDCCLKLLFQWVLLPVPGKFPYQLQFLIVLRCDKHRHGAHENIWKSNGSVPTSGLALRTVHKRWGLMSSCGVQKSNGTNLYKQTGLSKGLKLILCNEFWKSVEVFMASPTGYLAKIDAVSAS